MSPPRIVALAPRPTAVDEIKAQIIKDLEEALADARAGHLESVVIIAKCLDGHWYDRRSGTQAFPEAIGRLEIIKQGWITEYIRSSTCDCAPVGPG
jgi:hypothetical protein